MLTELDKNVLALQAVRRGLNNSIAELDTANKALTFRLKKIWKPERLAQYRKNESIINLAESDASFEEFSKLDERYKKSISSLTNQEFDRYFELAKRFHAYRYVDRKDIDSVKKHFASQIADIDKCAQAMMNSVKKYELCMADAVAMAQKKIEFKGYEIEELKSMFNLYAIIDEKLPTSGSIPNLLLSKRIEVMVNMAALGLLGKCSFANALKADRVHVVLNCYLASLGIEPDAFDESKMKVYQFQDTDMTKAQAVLTLEDAADLVKNAADNCVIVKNLAAIVANKIDASAIESEMNQKFVNVLVEVSPDVNKSSIGEVYGILVDKSGNIASSDATITELKERFKRIQQYKRPMQLPYVIDETYFPYSGNSSEIAGWKLKENKGLDGALFEFETA